MRTEVKHINDDKVLFCMAPDGYGEFCQSMTREELADVRDTINAFFLADED